MAEGKGESQPSSPSTGPPPLSSDTSSSRNRASSNTTAAGRFRSASNKFIDSNVPLGMWSATGNIVAKAPSLADIRRSSQGSRRNSGNSLPRSNTVSPSTSEFQGSPTKTRPERTRTGSSGQLEKITGEDDDGDGFPANIFGRGELNDQSFVRGQRASQISTRVPKLAVRKRETTEKKAEDPATESALSPTEGPSITESARPKESSSAKKSDEPKEAFPDFEEDDDDLDDLLPKPKRSSKNIDAMLGRTPAAASSSASGPIASGPAQKKGLKGDSVEEEFKDAAEHIEDEDDDLDDLMPKPKRSSKNVDSLLGRTKEKPMPSPPHGGDVDREASQPLPNDDGVYPNGYSFPPKQTWGQATLIGLRAFLRFTVTPLGFCIVLYGLNVVAWGGMLFLLLVNASPAMCQNGDGTYDCNNIDSPRRVWVEIDSQILNALFCVTGFGLIPWRFRDFYYLLKWRVGKKEQGLRKLAGYHNSWFRLPGSEKLPVKSYNDSQLWEDESNPALPIPLKKAPAPPLTGARAPPTAFWKLDFVIWAFVWNTFLQAVLSGFMWGLNRYDRPSWSTGLFVALACVVAGLGGLMQFIEGKRIKKVEGIPLGTEETVKDVEIGHQDTQNSEKQGTETESESPENRVVSA